MTHKPNYIDAIIVLDPNAKCRLQNEDLSTLVWEDSNPNNITNKQITDKHAELITEYNNNKYQRDRATAYPSIQDQLDMQYWDNVNSTTNWKDAIAKVKSDNPKPE
tara:strand:- start:142 stop:459 length:318 start_codon:yes stop_codon:yes gene_type:complete